MSVAGLIAPAAPAPDPVRARTAVPFGHTMSGTKLNALAFYVNFIVMAALGFVINPLLVHYLGAADFGIWKSCQRILDLSAVADGRAAQALKWVIAHQAKHDDVAARQRQVGAAAVIWLCWLPFLLLAVAAVVYALPWLINGITGERVAVMRQVGMILGANVILATLLGIPDAVLVGTNQGYRSVVLTTFFLVMGNLGLLAAARLGYGLPVFALVILTGSLLNGFSTWLVARRQVAWWAIRRPRRADVTRFAGFSNWTLAWALIQLVLLSTELLLIGFLTDPVMTTRYTFNCYVVQFALSICLMTGSAVMPKLGALIGSGELPAARHVIERMRELLLAIMAVSGAAIILLNRSFVSTWIGPGYYMGDAVNALMVLAFLQLALIRYDAQVQDVGLNIGRKVLVGLLGAAVSLALASLCYLVFRSLESLYVGLILGRLPTSLWLPRLVAHTVPGSRYSWRSVGVMAAIVGASILAAPLVDLHGWLPFAASSLVAAPALGLLTYMLVLSAETRAWLAPLRILRMSKISVR